MAVKKRKRNYKREYAIGGGTDREKKRRAQRNKARRACVKAGKCKKGDCKDVDHPTRNTASKKTRVISRKKNRSHGGKVGNKAGKARGGRKSRPPKRRKK